MPSAKQQAAFDLNLKLLFERDLRIKLRAYNEKLIRVYTKSVARAEIVPDFEQFQPELERILDIHYNNVGAAFTERINDMVAEELGEKSLTLVIETKAQKVPVVVAKHFKVRALSESTRITATTTKHAAEALSIAQQAAVDPANIALEQVNIASQSSATFRRRLNGRSTGIVRLATNESAEVSKLTQVQILRGEEPSLSGGGNSDGTKTWANQGDSKVRAGGVDSKFDHLTAEQTVKLNRPFLISGQQLRYPGDISLGASAGNVINCRCSVTYNIRDIAKKVKIQRNISGEARIARRVVERDLRRSQRAIQKLVASSENRITQIRTNPKNQFERMITIHSDVSNEYIDLLEEAWDSLPADIRKVLVKDGLPINIGKTAKSTTSAKVGRMEGAMGFYLPRRHSIHLGEFTRHFKELSITDIPGRVMVHEIGHAVDAIMLRSGGGSGTNSWGIAWRKANALIEGESKKALRYFLSHGKMNVNFSESFAESFASEYGPKIRKGRKIADISSTNTLDRANIFDKRMTATKNEMRNQVDKFIRKKKPKIRPKIRPASEFVPKPRPPGPLTPRRPPVTRRPPVAKPRAGGKKLFEQRPKTFKDERLQKLSKDGTFGAHHKPDGTWTPLRQDMHDEIVAEFLTNGKKVNIEEVRKFIPEYRKGISQAKGQFNEANVGKMTLREADYLVNIIKQAKKAA